MCTRLQKLFTSITSTSLLEIFKPVYVLFTIFGFLPYNLKFKTKHSCTIIHRSIYFNSLRAVTALLVMLIFAGYHARNIALGISVKDKAMMTQINYVLEVVFLLTTDVTAYCSVYFYRYTIINTLNAIASAWIELPTVKNDILKKLQCQVLLILFTLGILLLVQLIIDFTRSDDIWKMLNVIASFIYPQFIQNLALTFYCVMVLLLVALLRNLNGALEIIRKKRNVVGGFRNLDTRLSALDLSTMESVFVKAFDIKHNINKTFQATILLTAVQCFHCIVSEGHIIYHGLLVTRTLNKHEAFNFSMWIVYQLIKIYGLAYTGNILKEATVRIGQTLHNIPIDNHDMRSLIETQHFASLISYQSTDLSIYGFFSLDASFLFNIIASATMYLIILVQFDRTNNN